MAIVKRHTSYLDVHLRQNIGDVLRKLKCFKTVTQVQNWLENFEVDEVDLALNFLLFLEYVTFEELQMLLEPFIKMIATSTKGNHVLFVPYGKYVKSNDLIMYCISKSSTFKSFYNKKQFVYTRDILFLTLKQATTIVFVDDFIGTGKSFIKWYRQKSLQLWLKNNDKYIVDQVLLSAVVMPTGSAHISSTYPWMTLLGSSKNKIFDEKSSPFVGLGNLAEMKSLCEKYGNTIPIAFAFPKKIYAPLGYGNTESLIAFDYGTPNNTLPIIWGTENWQPIFPRVGQSRIKMISDAKKDASQFIGIIKRLGVNISADDRIVTGSSPIFIDTQNDFGLVCFLIFKMKGFSDGEIAQHLGVPIQILNEIIKVGRRRNLVNKTNDLTNNGKDLINSLFEKSYKFRENDSLEIKSTSIFVPSTFNNTT